MWFVRPEGFLIECHPHILAHTHTWASLPSRGCDQGTEFVPQPGYSMVMICTICTAARVQGAKDMQLFHRSWVTGWPGCGNIRTAARVLDGQGVATSVPQQGYWMARMPQHSYHSQGMVRVLQHPGNWMARVLQHPYRRQGTGWPGCALRYHHPRKEGKKATQGVEDVKDMNTPPEGRS